MMNTIINWMGGYSQEQVAEVIFAVEIIPLVKMFYHIARAYIVQGDNAAYHKDAAWGSLAWVISICLLGYGALWDEDNLLWTGGVMTSILVVISSWFIGAKMHNAVTEVVEDTKAILADDETTEEETAEEKPVADEPVQAKVDEVIEPKNLDDIQKDFDEKSKK